MPKKEALTIYLDSIHLRLIDDVMPFYGNTRPEAVRNIVIDWLKSNRGWAEILKRKRVKQSEKTKALESDAAEAEGTDRGTESTAGKRERERGGFGVVTSPPSPVPLPRATYLLLLLETDNGRPIEGRTRLEKLAFLVQQKVIEDLKVGVAQDSYHFRPLHYGPFTEEVFDDLTALRTMGLVDIAGDEASTQLFRITPEGQRVVRRLIGEGRVSTLLVEEIRKIKSTYGRMGLDELVGRVYREYPSFTEMSQIRNRYF